MAEKKDATGDGGSNDGQNKDQENQDYVDPREALVDSIVAKNDESRDAYEEEHGIGEDIPGNDDDQINDDLEKKEEKKTDEDQEDKIEMVEITVDGVKQSVPLSQIVDAGTKTLQKETAAEKRLQEATELLKEAKKLNPPDNTDDSPGDDDKDGKLTAAEIAHAIQYGTEEEATAAIEQFQNKGQSKDVLTPETVKTIVAKTVEETNNGKDIFDKFGLSEEKGGFGDILADPHLMSMASAKVNERLDKGEKNSWETYEAAGKEVREWVAGFGGNKEASAFDKKKDLKKQTDTVRGATFTKSSEDKDQKPPSASDVIREMAERRAGAGG